MGERLPVLLTRALLQQRRDVEAAGAKLMTAPSLLLWSSLLRFVGDEGVAAREVPKLARLSRRAMKAGLNAYKTLGIVTVEDDVVRLTPAGRAMRDAWRPLFAKAETKWRRRYGRARVDELRGALESLVQRFPLELAHYPSPYGSADWRITGGHHVRAKPGPPPIPAHGADWVVVRRGEGDTVSHLPLCALLGQALVAFTIDYEERHGSSMLVGANLLPLVPDRGLPLDRVPPVFAISGTGQSGLERHGIVKVDAKRKLVKLTAVGRKLREVHGAVVAGVEAQWCDRYGGDTVARVRSALEALAPELDAGGPDHPVVVWKAGVGFADLSLEQENFGAVST